MQAPLSRPLSQRMDPERQEYLPDMPSGTSPDLMTENIECMYNTTSGWEVAGLTVDPLADGLLRSELLFVGSCLSQREDVVRVQIDFDFHEFERAQEVLSSVLVTFLSVVLSCGCVSIFSRRSLKKGGWCLRSRYIRSQSLFTSPESS